MNQQRELEADFQRCVRSIGGIVLDEAKSGKTADFKFPKDNVIAELKTMLVDTSEKLNGRVKAITEDWNKANGRLPAGIGFERGQPYFELAAIEPEIAEKWIDLLRQDVERQVKDANAQIAETKIREGMPSARGIIIICNTNNTYHRHPESYRLLIASILRKRNQKGELRYPHINGAVYFSWKNVKGINFDGYFWTPLQAQHYADEDVSDVVAFQRRLRDGWYKYLGDTHGITVRQHETE